MGIGTRRAKKNSTPSEKKIAFNSEDKVKEFVPDENEYNYSGEPDAMAIMRMQGLEDDEEEDDDDDEDYTDRPAKRIKTTGEDDDEEDSKPAAVEKKDDEQNNS